MGDKKHHSSGGDDSEYDKVPGWKKIELFKNEIQSKKPAPFPPDSKKWFSSEEDEKARKKYWTAPYDARFPQANQTRACWTYYIDYHRCKKLKGEDYEPCEYFKTVYHCLCPQSWIDKFDGWMSEDRFPYDFSKV